MHLLHLELSLEDALQIFRDSHDFVGEADVETKLLQVALASEVAALRRRGEPWSRLAKP